MLIHLITIEDDQNHLYETTKACIELEHRRHQYLEYIDRQKRVEPHGQIDKLVNRAQHCETVGESSPFVAAQRPRANGSEAS